MGPSPKAPFDIDPKMARKLLDAPINVNGRPNQDVVVPVLSAVDIVRKNRGLYTVDFGLMDLDAASYFEPPFKHVRHTVLPVREQGRRSDYRGKWWQYARPRPELRAATAGLQEKIVTPAVAKHRLFVKVPATVLANQGTLVFAGEDDFFFGVLHSRIHEVWSLRMGTSLEDRPRYTPTTCFETFPLPWPPGTEPVGDPRVIAIGTAAKRLNELRENWLNPQDATEAELKKRTLTNLYNTRPQWLQNAHATLDRVVWDAYGWPEDEVPATVDEDTILSRLLALNLERAGGQQQRG